jgi:hypothetical protein
LEKGVEELKGINNSVLSAETKPNAVRHKFVRNALGLVIETIKINTGGLNGSRLASNSFEEMREQALD